MTKRYANVILPLKLNIEITYIVPESLENEVTQGSYVRVELAGKEYIGLVSDLNDSSPEYKGKIKEIISCEPTEPASQKEISFLYWIADYYMCTPGEVLKAASGNSNSKNTKQKKPKVPQETQTSELSQEQQQALEEINTGITEKKPVLLKGVTGSGKTEIYMKLASDIISGNRDVLIMVPEVALSRQLTQRIESHFPGRVLVYHSRQSKGARQEVRDKIRKGEKPYVVLGLRSALFLPFRNLGLIVVDEEHDTSYKQNDPAPRYSGRDSAVMLAKIHDAGIVLGSATPSMETLYNCQTGKFRLCELKNKFFSAQESSVEIIDTIRENKRCNMNGLFSQRVLEEIDKRIKSSQQVLIFRNRRSYSPMVQCIYCGDIPKCTNCNVSLSYHKHKGVLQCHYCEYHRRFSTICTSCGKPGLKERGCGTEMIEEEIKKHFPGAICSRLDSETASSKTTGNKILKDFSSGKSNILIGTQMVSKGFDFENLSLIILVQADSMFATEDFRAEERAMQMLVQLSGRGGRRAVRGHIMIQTSRPSHHIFKNFTKGNNNYSAELKERKEFGYPPYKRLIKIVVKHRDKSILTQFATKARLVLESLDINEVNGPFPPAVDRIKKDYILNILVKLKRNQDIQATKQRIFKQLNSLHKTEGKGITLFFDPDPL